MSPRKKKEEQVDTTMQQVAFKSKDCTFNNDGWGNVFPRDLKTMVLAALQQCGFKAENIRMQHEAEVRDEDGDVERRAAERIIATGDDELCIGVRYADGECYFMLPRTSTEVLNQLDFDRYKPHRRHHRWNMTERKTYVGMKLPALLPKVRAKIRMVATEANKLHLRKRWHEDKEEAAENSRKASRNADVLKPIRDFFGLNYGAKAIRRRNDGTFSLVDNHEGEDVDMSYNGLTGFGTDVEEQDDGSLKATVNLDFDNLTPEEALDLLQYVRSKKLQPKYHPKQKSLTA